MKEFKENEEISLEELLRDKEKVESETFIEPKMEAPVEAPKRRGRPPKVKVEDNADPKAVTQPKKRGRKKKEEIVEEVILDAEAYRQELAEEEAKEKEEEKKPGRRGKKTSNNQTLIMPERRGAWSDPKKSITMEKIYFEVELIESALGLCSSDKELLSTYIASKAPDALSKQEEIDAVGPDEVQKRSTTIFPKGWFKRSENECQLIDVLSHKDGGRGHKEVEVDENHPFFWNYQLRGFFKESCSLLSRGGYGESSKLSAYKKIIDGCVFVFPRRIAIEIPEVCYDDDGDIIDMSQGLPILQRRIRIVDRAGERVTLAASELVPAGSRFKFCVGITDKDLKPLIYEWMNYSSEHGFGGWRNSGRGIARWRELNSDYSPIISDDE